MDKRKLTAAPLYCVSCGTRHYASVGVPLCRQRTCRAKDFTTAISTVAWKLLMNAFNRNFLHTLRIASE